jgi:predicted ABC-type transport system involved in lysophospholipase L1 biosynthesis ATPase subunit
MAEPLLTFEGVRLHSSDGREYFLNIDWTVSKGTKTRILEESGSGATELLHLAAGIAHPENGRVVLEGVPLDPYESDHPFLKRGALGWVPSSGGLLVNQDLLSNLALPLRFIRGLGRFSAEVAAQAALEEVNMGHWAKHRPHSLEGGERWLIALIRAQLMGPDLWLVDRPPGDLDRRTRKTARRILDQVLSEAETTLVMVGEGAWVPEPIETLRLENGLLALGGNP